MGKITQQCMKSYMNGDREGTGAALAKAATGPFSHLTNAQTTAIGSNDGSVSNASYITPVNYWSLSACGITYGSTDHPEPPIEIGLHDYYSLSSAQSELASSGYYQVQWPWIDVGNDGKVYAKINTTGYGDCDNGEFRDENHIYDTYHVKVDNVWYEPVLSLIQVNEPNPDLNAYSAPTFW